jgi:hypothetical protein
MALPICLKFAPFPDFLPTVNYRILLIHYYFWISNGLREFLEIATVLKFAVGAFSKQYCLSDPPVGGERVVLRGQAEKQEPKNSLQP